MMKLITTIAAMLTLTSCAPITSFQTNVDPQNFKNYFGSRNMPVFKSESEFVSNYQLVSVVEGVSCQAKPSDATPSLATARTNAKKSAYDKGANAIIFTGCTTISTNVCHQELVCYAKAYDVVSVDS